MTDRTRRDKQKGSAMISVLLLTAVLAVLGTASLSLAEGGARRAAARRGIDRSYYAAESSALLAAERLAISAALHGASVDNAFSIPTVSEAAFTTPYMETAIMGVDTRRGGSGYVIRARAVAAQGECDIIMETDIYGGIVRVSAAQ